LALDLELVWNSEKWGKEEEADLRKQTRQGTLRDAPQATDAS